MNSSTRCIHLQNHNFFVDRKLARQSDEEVIPSATRWKATSMIDYADAKDGYDTNVGENAF